MKNKVPNAPIKFEKIVMVMINSKTLLVRKGSCESFSCEKLQGPHCSHNHGWNVKEVPYQETILLLKKGLRLKGRINRMNIGHLLKNRKKM